MSTSPMTSHTASKQEMKKNRGEERGTDERAEGEGKRKVRKKIDKRRKKGEKRKSGEEEERDKLVKVKRRVRKSKVKKWV